MIEARGLTKDYGDKRAVDGLTFTVQPGVVTGFLGPNGSGKSTTMRLILGLDSPTAGHVTVNGKHCPRGLVLRFSAAMPRRLLQLLPFCSSAATPRRVGEIHSANPPNYSACMYTGVCCGVGASTVVYGRTAPRKPIKAAALEKLLTRTSAPVCGASII